MLHLLFTSRTHAISDRSPCQLGGEGPAQQAECSSAVLCLCNLVLCPGLNQYPVITSLSKSAEYYPV